MLYFTSIKRLLRQDIVKVFSLTSVSTLVRMLTGFISVKVVAVIIGPAGIALLGQLNNFIGIVMSLASGGINNGIVKFTSEFKESERKTRLYFSTSLRITLALSFFSGIVLILFPKYWAKVVLFDPSYYYVFTLFGIALTLFTLNGYLMSIINGFKEFKLFVRISIISSLLGLFFSVFLVYALGLRGALISAVSHQSISFFVTLWFIRKTPWFNRLHFNAGIDKKIIKDFSKYSLMALVTAATIPVSQLFIRGYAISNISIIEAGWWESMNRISGVYLTIITASFGVYYLPRLSELRHKSDISKEIVTSFKIILPSVVLLFIMIFLFRNQIVRLLFSEEFLPMAALFKWQLIGDIFKISTWLIGTVLIAKTYTKLYILNEVIFSLAYVLLSVAFTQQFGIVGVTMAYAINYALALCFIIYVYKRFIKF